MQATDVEKKESSGSRRMVLLVQGQKRGSWRWGGGCWAVFKSGLLKWLSLFSAVSACGRLAQLRAMFLAPGALGCRGRFSSPAYFCRAGVRRWENVILG